MDTTCRVMSGLEELELTTYMPPFIDQKKKHCLTCSTNIDFRIRYNALCVHMKLLQQTKRDTNKPSSEFTIHKSPSMFNAWPSTWTCLLSTEPLWNMFIQITQSERVTEQRRMSGCKRCPDGLGRLARSVGPPDTIGHPWGAEAFWAWSTGSNTHQCAHHMQGVLSKCHTSADWGQPWASGRSERWNVTASERDSSRIWFHFLPNSPVNVFGLGVCSTPGRCEAK